MSSSSVVAVDLALVARGADRQRIERLVRDRQRCHHVSPPRGACTAILQYAEGG